MRITSTCDVQVYTMHAFLASHDQFIGEDVEYMHLEHNSSRIIPASLHPSGHPGSVLVFACLHFCLLLWHVNPLTSYFQVSLNYVAHNVCSTNVC